MRLSLCAAAFAVALIASTSEATPVSYVGGVYSQSFDGLPTSGSQTVAGKGPHDFSVLNTLTVSGMDGWQFANNRGGPSGTGGSGTGTEFRAQDGSLSGSAGRGTISFGTNGSSDRALGTLATSNQINSFGLLLTNNSNTTLTDFTVSFTGEQWRRGDVPSPNTLSFAYGFGANIDAATTAVAQLDFVGPNTQSGIGLTEVALDGNAAANQTALSRTISGVQWLPGQTLALRWNGQDQSGQDDGLAIDNLSFSASAIPEPASLALVGLCVVGLGLVRR